MVASKMAPDAWERDALRRELTETDDGILRGTDITFVTEAVSPEAKAAVIAVLLAQREADTTRVRRVERREREPWHRSQVNPEGISDLLHG